MAGAGRLLDLPEIEAEYIFYFWGLEKSNNQFITIIS